MANRIQQMGPLAGSFVVSEAEMWRSRDETVVAIPAGGLKSGTLLKAGAGPTDPLVPVTGVADEAIAVNLNNHVRDDEAVAQSMKITVMARDCELAGRLLVMPTSATASQKITLGTKLAKTSIVVRW